MERPYMFPHSIWFQPYVAGYYAHLQGLPEDRDYVVAHLDDLLLTEMSERLVVNIATSGQPRSGGVVE